MNKIGLAVLWLATLLVGCGGSLRGDANAGPNPGGGFYGAPNLNVGRINPRWVASEERGHPRSERGKGLESIAERKLRRPPVDRGWGRSRSAGGIRAKGQSTKSLPR
jgi:hypothetical protein